MRRMTSEVAEFLAHYPTPNLHRSVHDRYRYALGELDRVLDQREAATATWKEIVALVNQWRAGGAEDSTIQTYLSSLSRFYKWLGLQGKVTQNPVAGARFMTFPPGGKQQQTYRRSLGLNEVHAMLSKTPDSESYGAILLLAKTGIRSEEFCLIEAPHIRWQGPERGRLQILPHKKRTNCNLWLDEETTGCLEQIVANENRSTGPLFRTNRGNALDRVALNTRLVRPIAINAGLVEDWDDPMLKITTHCFRHSFTGIMTERGMDPDMVDEYRGDLRRNAMRDRYRIIKPEALRREYLRTIWSAEDAAQALSHFPTPLAATV